MSTFLPAMWAAFFIRVSPASRKAKPACMNMTSTAATTTQTVLTAITSSDVFIAPPLERRNAAQEPELQGGVAWFEGSAPTGRGRVSAGGRRYLREEYGSDEP